MTARARRGPAPSGQPIVPSASHNAAATDDRTGRRNDTRGAVVRLTGDLEAVAVDLLDKLGPVACAALAVALVELVREVGR